MNCPYGWLYRLFAVAANEASGEITERTTVRGAYEDYTDNADDDDDDGA